MSGASFQAFLAHKTRKTLGSIPVYPNLARARAELWWQLENSAAAIT
jgi:hypothetical protein